MRPKLSLNAHEKREQQVSSACNRKIIQQLSYKLSGATEVSEAYTSQTCPVCGTRHKCRRTYRCTLCSHTIPRDVVGALNIRRIGMTGAMMNSPDLPTTIKVQRPVKVFPKRTAVSSGGHPSKRYWSLKKASSQAISYSPYP